MQLGYWGWEEQVDIVLPGLESSFCPEGFAQKLKWSWGGRGEKLEEEEAEEPGAQAWPWIHCPQLLELTRDALLCLAWGFNNLPAAGTRFLHAFVLIESQPLFPRGICSFSFFLFHLPSSVL